jgi:hypothetical protein
MDGRLSKAEMVMHILFIFGIQEFTHFRSVFHKSEHSTSKNRDPYMMPLKRNRSFVGTFQWRSYEIKLRGCFLHRNNGTRTGGPSTEYQVSGNRLYRLVSSIVDRYSAISSGLPRYHRFRIEANVVKVSYIGHKMYVHCLCI